MSPTKNSQLLISLRLALAFASEMASGTLSTPITFLAFLDTNCAIVPVPAVSYTI
jgi:hypothetical protein